MKGNIHVAYRLQRDGRSVDVRWIRADCEGATAALERAIDLSAKSWKHTTGSTLDRPGPGDFIRRFTEHAVANGWLSIWQLAIDGVLVASEYQVIYEGNVHALRSDYDPDFDALSPGTYLNWQILERLFGTDLRYYSMGPGDNAYKQRWAEENPPQHRLTVYGKTLTGRVLRFLNERLKPLINRVSSRSRETETMERE
jgi:CelD/BcsL family acetyltransferase involved in cellulose biosynthesis